jgi:hypothetical protein
MNKYWVLFLIFLIFILFKIEFYPVYIDEATTYNDYVSKGLLEVITSYKEPNNHVFYSLLLCFFSELPFDILFSMRLLNLFLALIGVWVFYKFLIIQFSENVTLIALTFYMFSYYVLFYSIFARGYMLVILCTISLLYVLEIMKKKQKRIHFVIISVATFIGFAAIPIFLYVFLSILFIVLIRILIKAYPAKIILPLLISFFLVGIGVSLFYLPIIMNNGLDAIVKNKWTNVTVYSEVIKYIKSSWIGFYDRIFGVRSVFIVAFFFILGGWIVVMKKKNRLFIIENIVIIILPFIFILLHKVIPGVRTWSYLIVPFTLLVAFYLEFFMSFLKNRRFSNIMTFTICIIFIVVQILIFNKSHRLAAHLNDYYYGNLSMFLITLNSENIHFTNGDRSYEKVLYTFHKKSIDTLKNSVHVYRHSEIFVAPKNSFSTKKADIIYFDDNINLTVYKLK